MSDELKRIGETKLSSTITDPFTKDSITDIDVHYCRHSYGDREWYAWGTVEFNKNNTKGQVRFDGKTFDEVTQQISNFIKNEL